MPSTVIPIPPTRPTICAGLQGVPTTSTPRSSTTASSALSERYMVEPPVQYARTHATATESRTMRFSYAETFTDPTFLAPLAIAAEDSGYDSFVVPDSVLFPA